MHYPYVIVGGGLAGASTDGGGGTGEVDVALATSGKSPVATRARIVFFTCSPLDGILPN